MSHNFRESRASISLAALLLISSSGSVSAAEPGRTPDRIQKREEVVRTVKLKPHAKAEVMVPNFSAHLLVDGSVTLTAATVVDAEETFGGYDFEVDMKRGIYRTWKIREDDLREAIQESASSSESLTPIFENYEFGPYRVRAYVQTKDPVDIVLTETYTSLEWGANSDGSIDYIYAGDYCWADPETSAGTSWYTEYCQYSDLWWAADRSLCNDVAGWYYNYDWRYDTDKTTAYGRVEICGQNNGGYRPSYSANFTGEDNWLLRGSFYHYRYYTNM